MNVFSKQAGCLLLALLAGAPAFGQVGLSGVWADRITEDSYERSGGPPLGDYQGIPLNDAGRMKADSHDHSEWSLPEFQCRPHPAPYQWRALGAVRISEDIDPVSRELRAYHLEYLRSMDRWIYMDGRPHPAAWAPHSWSGFSTGKWEGNMLTVTVTHLKEGYIRRNGMPRSDKATVTEHWIRHGNFLTITTIVNDPIYLTEPFIRTTDYELDLTQHVPPYPCEMVQEVERPKGVIPHHLFGQNKDLREFSERYGLPFDATRGGAETMYPDYRKKLKMWMGPTPTAKFPGEVN